MHTPVAKSPKCNITLENLITLRNEIHSHPQHEKNIQLVEGLNKLNNVMT